MMEAVIILVALVTLACGLLIGARCVIREQSNEIERLSRDMAIMRQDNQALMESIARANRTPVFFNRDKKPLEKLDGWYESQPQLTKITSGAAQ